MVEIKTLIRRRAALRRKERRAHRQIETLAAKAFALRDERFDVERELRARGVRIDGVRYAGKNTHVSNYPTRSGKVN